MAFAMSHRRRRYGIERLAKGPLRTKAPQPRPVVQQKPGCTCGGGCPSCESARLSHRDDPAEREADAVAAQVLGSASATPSVRAVSHHQPMRSAESGGLARSAGSPLAGLGQGAPLPVQARRSFELRFGHSFDKVRIHDGPAAADRAAQMNAQAFTYGRDIVFGAGRFRPDTVNGQFLLAHELTHTIQQGEGRENPTVMRVSTEDCGAREADLLVRHFAARRLLKKAIEMTAERDERKDRMPVVKAALLKRFKIDMDSSSSAFTNAKHLRHVENAMQTALDGSEDVSYECDQHGLFEICAPGRNAHTIGGSIHICPDWWNQPDDRKAIILIHEWTHKYGEGVARLIETYCWEKDWGDLPASERIQMPDAYEAYISQITLGTGTC